MDHLPLLTACIEHNDKDGLKWILDEEASAEKKANCSLAVLSALFCADTGALEQLQFLLDESYISVEDSDWAVGRGVMVRAARAAQTELVKMLAEDKRIPLAPLDSAAQKLADVTGEEKETQSALTAAAEHGSISVVRLLVERLQVPVDQLDLSGRTALSYCSEQMETAVVLISLGADVAHKSVEEAGLSNKEWMTQKEGKREDISESMSEKETKEEEVKVPVKEGEATETTVGTTSGRNEGLASSWDTKAVVESKSKLHSASAIQRRAKLLSLTSTASPGLVIDSPPVRAGRSTSEVISGAERDVSKNVFSGLTVASKFKRAQTGKNVLLRSDIEHAKAVLQKATLETDQARTENLDLSVEVQQLKAHVTKLRSNIAAIRKHLDRTAVESGGLPFNPASARVGAKRATQPAGVAQRLRASATSNVVKRSSAVC